MRKIESMLVALLAAGSVQLSANDIEPSKEKYTASFTLTPITLDGKLSEWAGAGVIADPRFAVPKGSGSQPNPNYVLFEEYNGGTWSGPEDQTSAVQVVYDADNVYFGFVVTDDYHENGANSAWNGDSVQLMIANATRTQQVALYNYALGGIEGETGEVIVMHEAGPGGTEAVVTRDAAAKKTYYEIKLPAASMGFTALTPGLKFGLGMAINDGDLDTPGQKGWGGLGAHSIVFGKTPGETAEITLGANQPTIEVLGVGAEFLLGGDKTDPENDGNEEAGPTDPSWNWAAITSNDEPGFGGGEFSFNIFDNLVGGGNDKWCCTDPTADKPLWVSVQFPQPLSVTHFTVTSGNDTPDRRPTKWQIQGSNDGQNFTPIFVQDSATALWTEHNQVIKFTLPIPSVPFRHIRYYVTETPGTLHQINEIEYFGTFGGTALAFYSGINPAIETFAFRITDAGTSVVDPASLKLIIDGQQVSIGNPAKVNGAIDVTYRPAVQFLPGTSHSYKITAKDAVGNTIESESTWTTPNYAFLQAGDKATADTSKRGFVWNVHQNNAFQANDNTRPLQQLAGLLGVNQADPAAQGVAIAAGTPGANNRLPIRFEIETVINLDQESGSNGEFTPDDQMPGIPGTGEAGQTDGIAGEIVTFIELPAGKHTLIVNSDDGFRTSAGNVYDVFRAQVAGEFQGGRGASDTPYTIYVAEAGVYPFRTVWQEGGGGANIEWKIVKADGTRALINDVDNGGPRAYRAAVGGSLTAVTSVSPVPNQSLTLPSANIELVITEGTAAVDPSKVKLALDGSDVAATVTKNGSTITVSYNPPSDFASPSTHKAKLTFTAGTTERSDEWSFTVPPTTKDKTTGKVGFIIAGAKHSASGEGRSGAAGDHSMDFGVQQGTVNVIDATFLNAATAGDKLTMATWQKLNGVVNGSAFWANSTSSSGSTRGFQAHAPWGDGTIYFDSAGCCAGDTQRISLNISEFPGYSGDPVWWQSWHHFAFVKNGAVKEIYIDGQLFHSGGGDPLPTDFTNLILGGGPGTGDNRMSGKLDDFVIYSTGLTQPQVDSLFKGTAPAAVSGNPGLIAHWDFNDPPVAVTTVKVMVARDGNNVRITSEPATLPAGWVLQTAPSATGPWATQAGATTPLTVPIAAGNAFLRAAKP